MSASIPASQHFISIRPSQRSRAPRLRRYYGVIPLTRHVQVVSFNLQHLCPLSTHGRGISGDVPAFSTNVKDMIRSSSAPVTRRKKEKKKLSSVDATEFLPYGRDAPPANTAARARTTSTFPSFARSTLRNPGARCPAPTESSWDCNRSVSFGDSNAAQKKNKKRATKQKETPQQLPPPKRERKKN